MMTQLEALEWVAGLFEQPVAELSPETPLDQIPMWDSLGILTLMADFDEKFGIVLNDEDMHQMRRVDDILEVLRKQGKLQPAAA